MHHQVFINKTEYTVPSIFAALQDELFEQIRPGDYVIIKPNWVMESHKFRKDDWEYVITHPAVITAVMQKVLDLLNGSGSIAIIDGPMTEASFNTLISRYPISLWKEMTTARNVTLEIIDLREHEWKMKNDVVVERKSLSGDPKGKAIFDLIDNNSEFWSHKKSCRGYYGADYDRTETNKAHDGHHNLYSVSRTVIESDVFINIPKLKTHRTAGITCCLKNLVGINTYKNYLPHYSEGGPSEDGDQFPDSNLSSKIEGPTAAFIKQHILKNTLLAKCFNPVNAVGKLIFGDSNKIVRNGSWHGNDTLWRMILDLNKVLLYSNADGTMRANPIYKTKHYIGIVDAVLAGEGEGPLAPDPVEMERIICGSNPVAIDATCATLMGFDPAKIPTISNAFKINHFPLCNFGLEDIQVFIDNTIYNLSNIPVENIIPFKPQHGWKGHIEFHNSPI